MAVLPALIGCSSGGAHAHARSASDVSVPDAEIAALRVQLEESEQELRTVRGQLALARAEVQELKGATQREPVRSERVRDDALPWNEDMKPVLEIDGEVVDERLPVTTGIPDLPSVDFEAPEAEAEPRSEPAVSIEGYRRGLQLVRQQRFEEALIELDAFAAAHPSHPYADNALFWCGEIHYLRRVHKEALRYFEHVEKLYPWGNKAPDALYRMGLIYLKRGDTARAEDYFKKVREQFPDTAAARLALREDAS